MAAPAQTFAEVADHIKKMKFRRKLFGGVDEEDVWKKIRDLDLDYQNLYRSLELKYKRALGEEAEPVEDDDKKEGDAIKAGARRWTEKSGDSKEAAGADAIRKAAGGKDPEGTGSAAGEGKTIRV